MIRFFLRKNLLDFSSSYLSMMYITPSQRDQDTRICQAVSISISPSFTSRYMQNCGAENTSLSLCFFLSMKITSSALRVPTLQTQGILNKEIQKEHGGKLVPYMDYISRMEKPDITFLDEIKDIEIGVVILKGYLHDKSQV